MLNTGDWIVPRIQGEPVFFRPPLQNWMIAVVGLCRGEVDAWAVRLPSQLAILGMVILLYGYCRTFLSRAGALACGLVFATFGQVLELGRLGETESVFTFFLAGALLTWRWCVNARVNWWATWGLSYALAALATLTKGPQAPVYFCGSIWIFLVLSWDWKRLFSWAHLFGIVTALCVVALWQVPYALQMGWETSFRVYFGDVGPIRFNSMSWKSVGAHMVSFPAELLFGSLLPWSLCLLAYANKGFRASLGRAGTEAFFLATCVAVTFPSVLPHPGASLRYYMPQPRFAGLVAIVLERGVFARRPKSGKSGFSSF
ncbi:MAG: glycosyltransferase family 39 protein [Planctomycetales bacterium]